MVTQRILLVTFVCLFAAISAHAQDDFSRIEIFGGFSIMHPTVPGNLGRTASDSADIKSLGESVIGTVPGWGASATLYFNRIFGITADFSGHYKSADEIEGFTVRASGDLHTFLFGPTISIRVKRLSPFVHALFGMGRVGASAQVTKFEFHETGLAASVGGGLDINVKRHFAIRAIEADYFPYRHADGNSSMFNNMRWRMGIVIH